MTFNATELTILQQLQRGNNWLRAVLCTLARRGVAFRLAYPLQTQYILDSMTTLPYYKGGQFLFDLMEWEDFMLDGPPAPLLASIFNVPMSDQLKALVSTVTRTISAQFGPSNTMEGMEEGEGFVLPEGEFPALESSLYLYQEVVLGLIASQLVRTLEPDKARAGPGQIYLALNPEAAVLMPGDIVTVTVTLVNDSQVEQEIRLSLEGFPLDWATFTENDIYLVAGEEKRVGLTIQAPADNPSLAHLYSYQVFGATAAEESPLSQASGTLLVQSLVPINKQDTTNGRSPT